MGIEGRLLAVVAVDKDKRIPCQAPGCGHGVYARIHVVEQDGRIRLYGADCFGKIFGGADALGRPVLPRTQVQGRLLTPEQRDLLLANARELIASFTEDARRLGSLAEALRVEGRGADSAPSAPDTLSLLELARRELKAEFQLTDEQLDSAGWSSLVRTRLAEIRARQADAKVSPLQ